jgi:hypothetical protein
LRIARLAPASSSPFVDLPPPAAIEESILGSLHAKHVVNGHGHVTDGCRAALTTLASPTHRASLFMGATDRWFRIDYYAGPGGLAGHASVAQTHQLTFPCTIATPETALATWLQWRAVPAIEPFAVDLGLAELSVIAAIADAWREEALHAVIDRRAADLSGFTREHLAYELAMADHGDARWFAGLLAMQAPPGFAPSADHLNAGAHALADRGWLCFDNDRVAPEPPLVRICSGLANLSPYVRVHVEGAGSAPHTVLVATGVQSYWAVKFASVQGQRVARLEALGGPGVGALLREHLHRLPAPASAHPRANEWAAPASPPPSARRSAPAAPPATAATPATPRPRQVSPPQPTQTSPPPRSASAPSQCPKCGTSRRPGAKFCGKCGERM